ncbi:hypothetical protein MMC20_007556 [Loxospora ochrophaea]|nr:hypothetical protein [Loxospora ochrophaea]
MSGSSLWKVSAPLSHPSKHPALASPVPYQPQTILLPPLFAALLYLLTTYLLLPLYRHHRRNHTSYLPLSTPSTARPPLLHRLLSLFSPFPSSRRPSLTPYLGDEELEEGLLSHHETRFPNHPTEHAVNTADDDVSSERRLSRELEGGFRDDSSSDGEERGRRPRRQ